MASPGSVAQWHDEVDVLIAGFGVAGCAAALGARDADAAARILIVEKMPEHLAGGNGRVSGQLLLISHDAEALYQYQKNMSVKNPVPDEMLREWARQMAEFGAGEILLTSMDRDGTKIGFDLDLTRAVSDAVPVPVIASGGVGELQHLVDGVQKGGADAVLAASIFHYGQHTVAQAKALMAARGVPVRL